MSRSAGQWARRSGTGYRYSGYSKWHPAAGRPNPVAFGGQGATGDRRTLTAATGATLKELMARIGHSSVRAAMIYQHATRDRDQAIAKALGTFARGVSERRREASMKTTVRHVWHAVDRNP